MPRRVIVVAIALMATINGCRQSRPTTPPLSTPVATILSTPATCGGFGIPAPNATMTSQETALGLLLTNYRLSIGAAAPGQDIVTVGAARVHAADMAAHRYVGFVASDGEDVFRRIVCSPGGLAKANMITGVVAVGFSTDPNAVFQAVLSSQGSRQVISSTTPSGIPFNNSLSVGYSGGYWMIILQ